MSYHVLARKWRPQTFADLVGQTHVVKALTYALSQNQIHHAYLFTGTRGVGKTSIARIFAKSLNCETNGVSPNPCGQCQSCQEIEAGKFVDLIEVDAASRTGVDETRELIDSVAYLPSKGRYKVYLIDEVHMFSKSSFNALLKTLEEPPEHVKFILATTDPEKLPITILSRCLQFNLKSLTPSQIRQHLENICQTETIQYDPAALALLASAGDGSMRDTLSLTDQAIAYGHGELRLSAVSEILGTIQPADIEAILFAIATNNPYQLSTALHRLDDYEVDARAFLIAIMQRLQRMAWAKEGIVEDLSPALQSTVGDIPKALLHLWYDIAEKALPNLAIAGEPRQAVEMALLRMLAFIPDGWVTRHRTLLDNDNNAPADKPNSDHPDNNATPSAQPGQADNDFAAEIQASPVPEHDSLAAAEAQFLAEHPPVAKADAAAAPTTTTAAAENSDSDSPAANVQQSVPAKHERADDKHPDSNSPDNSDNSADSAATQWQLSTATDDSPAPSMDDIRALMQRGSDLKANSATTTTTRDNDKQPITSETPPWEDPTPPQADDNLQPATVPDNTATDDKTPAEATSPDNTSTSLAQAIDNFDWFENINQLQLSEYTRHFAGHGIVRLCVDDKSAASVQAVLDLSPKNEVLITDDSIDELRLALQNHFDTPIQLAINLTQIDASATPAQRYKRANAQQQQQLLTRFKNEPITAKILQHFDAEVLESTVKARNPSS